jgi:peptidyl-prolyl cis-trans isomerase C
MSHASTPGCGSGACQCGEAASATIPAINGLALLAPDEHLDPETLMERAWGELLRQEAVRRGLLPRQAAPLARPLAEPDRRVIEEMLETSVPLAAPDAQECRRYYEANLARYVTGRAAHLRHILFAVTDGIDVEALARRAEEALRQLTARDAPADRFAALARELSNCPSAAEGGDLGWLGPEDMAGELARELFQLQGSLGLLARLVHSRFGLHIVEVLERRPGRQLAFEEVQNRIAGELAQRSRATALHQYIRVLAGGAVIEGLDLEATASPLVQ